jgi:type 1 glutamine amidotransferase
MQNHLTERNRATMTKPASALSLLLIVSITLFATADESSSKPLRALIITGGCCHDYDFQTKAIQQAAADRGVAIEWTVVKDGGNGTDAQIDLYNNPDWAKGFHVVIHNECFADTTDADYIRKITSVHKAGVNAVVIHCAMHTYRAAKIDDWRELLGVTSRHHEHQSRYAVHAVAVDHPVMQGFPDDYKTPMDELYVIEHVWPNTEVLARSTSEKTGETHPVIWTNNYGKARVFGTTYGHSNATFSDEVFLTTLTRGIQWAAGRLGK